MTFLTQLIADLAFYLPKWLPIFYFAALNTLQMVGWSMLFALSLGLLLALGRRSELRALYWSCATYVELMRGIPAFAFLYFVYYGLPALAISVNSFQAAVIALGLNAAAYMSEIYRAGIESVHRGQGDAARAIGMTSSQGMRYVILPQALRVVFPPGTNLLVEVLKSTALASAIGAPEIMNRATELTTNTFKPMAVYLTAGMVYLTLTLPLARLARWLERRVLAGHSVAA
jgi:polar amino acid transport system permease protein